MLDISKLRKKSYKTSFFGLKINSLQLYSKQK